MANYSLGEIDALARKATRGAGYSWGIAEEVGKSVRWLSAYGFSGAELLSKHLLITQNASIEFLTKLEDQNADQLIFINEDEKSQNTLCALNCCALINDLGYQIQKGKTLSFDNMLFPLLALPSAGRIAEAYDISVSFEYEGTEIVCGSEGITLKDNPPLLCVIGLDKISDVVCNKSHYTPKNTHFPKPHSREIKKEVLDILESFAHQTYAPATEESRMRGAGE